MMFKFKLILTVILLLETCNTEKSVPSCIVEKIKAIKAEKTWNPPASIWEYEYNGKTVYFIPARCCDLPSFLYDSDCNLICNPDGGYTGKGDGKCADFFEKRKGEVLIWKDERM